MKFLPLVFLVTTLNIAFAADTGGDGGSGSGYGDRIDVKAELTQARSLIASERYRYAIQTLRGVVQQDFRNADAWNLLGYSHRKMGKLKKAGKAYRKALKYNPEHKGALEYQGELFVQLENIEGARANLAKLKALCPEGCEQWSDLAASLNAQ